MSQRVLESADRGRSRPQWDAALSLTRLTATLMIVACHMMQWADCELAWWFNVGVQIFFCMSGCLYGVREIRDDLGFYRRSFSKILLDYYIVVIPAIVVYRLLQPELLSQSKAVGMLLTTETVTGGGHLWFISYILFCYALTPFLNRLLGRLLERGGIVRHFFALALLLALVRVVTTRFMDGHFDAPWISCYLLGLFLGTLTRYGRKGERICFCGLAVVMAVGLNTVQIATNYTDLSLYAILFRGHFSDSYYEFCQYAHTFLGVACFLLLRVLFALLLKGGDWLARPLRGLGRLSDHYSYQVYLVHHWAILGPFSLMAWTPRLSVNLLLIAGWIVLAVAAVTLTRRLLLWGSRQWRRLCFPEGSVG